MASFPSELRKRRFKQARRQYGYGSGGYGFAEPAVPPAPYTFTNTEAETLVARMSTQTDARKLLIDTLVGAGKTHGWWAKLDLLSLYAANDQASCLLNWKGTSFTPTLSEAHTFTADRGLQRTTVGGYIDTNMLASGGTQHVNNACGVYFYTRTAAASGANDAEFGCDAASTFFGRLRPATDILSARIQSSLGSFNVAGVTDASGFWAFTRSTSGGTAVAIRRNKVALTVTGTATGTALPANNYRVGRNSTSANSNATGREFSMFAVGANLTVAQSDFFYDDLIAYLTAIGAYP